MTYRYYDPSWFTIHDYTMSTNSFKMTESASEPTPEFLRKAARVLEDKAKELEKPKFTKRQQEFLDRDTGTYLGMDVLAHNNGKLYWITDEDDAISYSKGTFWGGLTAKESTASINGETVPLVTRFDKTYVHWDRL